MGTGAAPVIRSIYPGVAQLVRARDLFIRLVKMPELNPKHRGALTELQVMTYLFELGYQVSIPYGDNARYDFVLDIDNKLYKIQVKSASLEEDGVYKIDCSRMRVNRGENVRKHYTSEEVDFFATMINNKCYLIPQSEVSDSKRLRFVKPKNGQTKGITFAKDYEAETQIEKLPNNF